MPVKLSAVSRARAISTAALSITALGLLGTEAQAAPRTWEGGGTVTNPSGGNWNAAGNWLENAIPGAGDALTFGGGATSNYTSTNNINQIKIGSITLDSISANTITITGSTLHSKSNDGVQTWQINQVNSGAFIISTPIEGRDDILQLGGDGSGLVTLSGVISGQNSNQGVIIEKSGSSTFVLTGSNSNFESTTINDGVLNIRHNNALGGGGVTINSGGALEMQNNISSGVALTISGTGVSNGGALRNVSGNNTWTGAITLAGNARINSDAGVLTLSDSNFNTGGNNIAFGGAGDIIVSKTFNGTGNVTYDGPGTLQLNNAIGNRFVNLLGGTLKPTINSSTNFQASIAVTQDATIKPSRATNGSSLTHSFIQLNISNSTLIVAHGDGFNANQTGSLRFTGDTTIAGTATFQTDNVSGTNAGRLVLGATVTGGQIIKTGAADLEFAGTTDNTHGLTTLNAGTIRFNKNSGGSGRNAISSSGLVINGGTALYVTGTPNEQIHNSATVTINGGTLDVNGHTETLGTLALGGGTVSNSGGASTITVGTDYSNSAWTAGNLFDPKANVAGSVTINASGSAVQSVLGDGLASSTGANVNWVLGNVRVNSDRTLTVMWGSGGPSLRVGFDTSGLNGLQFFNGATNETATGGNIASIAGGNQTSRTIRIGSSGSISGTLVVKNNFDNVTDQTINISGTAYDYASTAFDDTPATQNFGNVRVGGTHGFSLPITNTAAGSGDNLITSYTSPTGVTPTTSAPLNLAPGASGNVVVGLDTSAAGVRNGSITVNAISDGSPHGLDSTTLASKVVTVEGTAYNYAATDFAFLPSPTVIDFGVVHVGDVVSQSYAVNNTGPAGAFTDTLISSLANQSGNITVGGVSVAAGSSQNLTMGLHTSAASAGESGSVEVSLVSNGSANGLDDLTLGTRSFSVQAVVNDYAEATIEQTGGSGSLTGGGTSYLIDLGTVAINSGIYNALLAVKNDANSLIADFLKGAFDLNGVDDFNLGGFVAFSDIASGQQHSLNVSFNTAGKSTGVYTDTIVLSPRGYNAGGYDEALAGGDITLTLQIALTTPVSVPEPTGLGAVLAMAGGAMLARRRRRFA